MAGVEQSLFHFFLVSGEPIEHVIKIILVDLVHAECFLYRLLLRPSRGLQPAPLDHQPGKDEKKGAASPVCPAQDRIEADLLRDLPKGEEGANRLTLFRDLIIGHGLIKIPPEKPLEHLYSLLRPSRDIGNGAALYRIAFPVGLPDQYGGRRSTIGDSCDIHKSNIPQLTSSSQDKYRNYMPTL